MRSSYVACTSVFLSLGCLSQQAFSYVGPGLGAGTLGVILGLLGSLLLALFAFFWYPIKRALFSKKSDVKEEAEEFSPIEAEPDTAKSAVPVED